MNVKDKVAIVTGGTGGIGFATVLALLKHGAKYVAILDLDSMHTRGATCEKRAEEQYGKDRAHYYTCDVTKQSEFAARYDEIVGMQRSVDILVNYATIASEPRAQHMIDVNLTAVINCTLIGIDRMGRHHKGQGGTIVNVSSVFGLTPSSAFPIYTATKYGVYGFVKALKDHYDNLGVSVMGVCPGLTETSLLHQDLHQETLNFIPDDFLNKALSVSKYIQQPENVGAAIVAMIEKGKAGDVWVSEDNEPPYAIEDPKPFRERKVKVV